MVDNLETVVDQYLKEENTTLLPFIFSEAVHEATRWIKYNKIYEAHELPDDFATEAGLEFISRIKSKGFYSPKSYRNSLQWICKVMARQVVASRITTEDLAKQSYHPTVEDKMETEENLLETIDGLSLKNQCLILYVYHYGSIATLPNFRPYLTLDEYAILSQKILNMKDIDNPTIDVDEYLPETPIGRMFLLSMLISKNPTMASLLIMFKDFKKFFQFIILFGGTKVEIPKVSDIVGDMVEASRAVSKMETDDTVLQDLDMFKEFVIDSDPEFKLNESLADFIQCVFTDNTRLFVKAIETALKNVAKSTYDESVRSFTKLLEQSQQHTNLLKSLVTLSSSEVQKVIDLGGKKK